MTDSTMDGQEKASSPKEDLMRAELTLEGIRGDRAYYYGSATAVQLLMTMAEINGCMGNSYNPK